MRNAIIRCDASTEIGTGHVMRCLTLANELRESDFCVRFVCRDLRGNLCALIANRGFEVEHLPADLPWEDDAGESCKIIALTAGRVDWLVVDHYSLARGWESTLRSCADRILVIDDLADRSHDCDLLLDQNFVAHMDTRYEGRVPTGCGKLLGTRYALLQPVYAELHERAAIRVGAIRRIFIFFGGADNANLTGLAVRAFLRLRRADIQVDVVISEAMTHAAAVREQAAGHGNIHVHCGLPTLGHLMVQADLAVGAAGAASWERLCVGLPAVVITLADNQRAVANALQAGGLIRWLGHQDRVDEQALTRELGGLIETGLEPGWSSSCLTMVDGRGAARVAAAVTPSVATPLHVRPVTPADEAMLLNWANDPVTRRNAFHSAPISAEAHRRWFDGRLRSSELCRFYIVQTQEGLAIGQVRFDLSGDSWLIDFAIAPPFRGRGCGVNLMRAALSQLRLDVPHGRVNAYVKASNRPSRRVFDSLGFESRPGSDDVNVYSFAF